MKLIEQVNRIEVTDSIYEEFGFGLFPPYILTRVEDENQIKWIGVEVDYIFDFKTNQWSKHSNENIEFLDKDPFVELNFQAAILSLKMNRDSRKWMISDDGLRKEKTIYQTREESKEKEYYSFVNKFKQKNKILKIIGCFLCKIKKHSFIMDGVKNPSRRFCIKCGKEFELIINEKYTKGCKLDYKIWREIKK